MYIIITEFFNNKFFYGAKSYEFSGTIYYTHRFEKVLLIRYKIQNTDFPLFYRKGEIKFDKKYVWKVECASIFV